MMQRVVTQAGRGKRGFTVLEALLLVVVLAVLAAIVLPRFVDSDRRSSESMLKNDLRNLRYAIGLFYADTGLYPIRIDDLGASSAPAKGLDLDGAEKDIVPGDWHGPYIEFVPANVLSPGGWIYSITPPAVGQVNAPAPYQNW